MPQLTSSGIKVGLQGCFQDFLHSELCWVEYPSEWIFVPFCVPLGYIPRCEFAGSEWAHVEDKILMYVVSLLSPTIIPIYSAQSACPHFHMDVCTCLAASSHVWLCDPMDCSLLGSSVHGILQAKILEWAVGYHALLQEIFPTQGIKPISMSPELQVDSLHWAMGGGPSSHVWKKERKRKSASHVWLFATPWNSPWSSPARILEWVAIPFSNRSSRSSKRIGVFCIVGGFFTSWATRKAVHVYWALITLKNTVYLEDEK